MYHPIQDVYQTDHDIKHISFQRHQQDETHAKVDKIKVLRTIVENQEEAE